MKRKVTDRQRASCVNQVGVQNDLARKSVSSYGSTPRYPQLVLGLRELNGHQASQCLS